MNLQQYYPKFLETLLHRLEYWILEIKILITLATVPTISYANLASTSVEIRPGTSFVNALPTLTIACH